MPTSSTDALRETQEKLKALEDSNRWAVDRALEGAQEHMARSAEATEEAMAPLLAAAAERALAESQRVEREQTMVSTPQTLADAAMAQTRLTWAVVVIGGLTLVAAVVAAVAAIVGLH